jgi:ParB-like chromosome segregation protein Spo0J
VVVAEGERFVLIDGYLRVGALSQLKRDTVAATAWPLDEAEALIQRHHLQSSSRSALEEAWFLARLREQGLSQDDLARRLCRSRSWVSRRLALLAELGASVQARVRAGAMPAHAAMKYLVPLARANRQQCERLVEALGALEVSDRDVAALYDGWRRADAVGRQRLLADPALFLRAVRVPAADAADDGSALVKELTTLSAVAWRARQRIGRDGLARDATYNRIDLGAAWRSAANAFDALRAAITEAWPDAGPDDPNHHPQAP